jgi:hypothetical protein
MLNRTESVRGRIAVRGQARLPPRRYPYGPVNAGLATRPAVDSFTLPTEKVRASGTPPTEAVGP